MSPFRLNGGYVVMPIDAKPMRSYQYNLSYQRQLMERVLLDVTYTGNQQRVTCGFPVTLRTRRSTFPATASPANTRLTAPGPCSNTSANNRQARSVLTFSTRPRGRSSASTPAATIPASTMASMDGEGHYNGLKIGIQKRMSSGWSANANYTLSKCINQGEPATDIGWNLEVTPQAPDYKIVPNFEPATGPCANDRRHLFNLSSVLISPGVGSGFVRVITKDWQVGLIIQARSGSPLTPAVSNDNALTGEPNQRPLIVEGVDPYLDEPVLGSECRRHSTHSCSGSTWRHSPTRRLGDRGNTRRGHIYGPGFWNTDLAFSRNLNCRRGTPHRTARRGVQPVQSRELGQPERDSRQRQRGHDHDDQRRSAHHAVRGEVRVLRKVTPGVPCLHKGHPES